LWIYTLLLLLSKMVGTMMHYRNDKSQLISLPITNHNCNSVCLNVGKETQSTLWKVTPSCFGISSLGTNKDQLLHRIQSVQTITNLQLHSLLFYTEWKEHSLLISIFLKQCFHTVIKWRTTINKKYHTESHKWKVSRAQKQVSNSVTV